MRIEEAPTRRAPRLRKGMHDDLENAAPPDSLNLMRMRRIRASYTSFVPLKVARTRRAMTKQTDRRAVKLAHMRSSRAMTDGALFTRLPCAPRRSGL